MARPEYFGGGDDSELDKAFWDVIGGVEVEVESAIQQGDADFPRLWMGNTSVAADSLAGETFRKGMLQAIDGHERESAGAITQALREQLQSPGSYIQLGSQIAFRGVGVVLAPPTEQHTIFREVCLDENLFIIGCLQDALFDHYWYVKSRSGHTGNTGQEGGYPMTWIKESRLGPVAVLKTASFYRSTGHLISFFPQLRVPLAQDSLQPLKVYTAT